MNSVETQCLERHDKTCRISFLSFIYLFAHRSWISPFHISPKTSVKLFNLVRKQWLGLLHFRIRFLFSSLRSACLSYFHTDKESIPRVCEGFTQDRLLASCKVGKDVLMAKISWNCFNSWEILNQRKSQIEQNFLMTWHSRSLQEALKTRKFSTVYVGMISIPHWELKHRFEFWVCINILSRVSCSIWTSIKMNWIKLLKASSCWIFLWALVDFS